MAFRADNSQAALSIVVDTVVSPTTGDVQLVKIADARAGSGNLWNVESDGAARSVADAVSATTNTSVTQSATVVTLVASNTSRRGLWCYNDSVSNLYIRLAASASVTVFAVLLFPGDFWEMPVRPIYNGIVTGIWTAAGTGAARMTEM